MLIESYIPMCVCSSTFILFSPHTLFRTHIELCYKLIRLTPFFFSFLRSPPRLYAFISMQIDFYLDATDLNYCCLQHVCVLSRLRLFLDFLYVFLSIFFSSFDCHKCVCARFLCVALLNNVLFIFMAIGEIAGVRKHNKWTKKTKREKKTHSLINKRTKWAVERKN